jgi:3-oxoacyl-[acyl-carrier protein] reductase
MTEFTGKTLILSGANGAIGREIAVQFRAAGANVAMGDFAVDPLRDFATNLDPTGDHVLSFHLNASSSTSNESFVAAAVDKFGSIDFVVPAAGIYPEQAISEMTNEQWNTVISVNLVRVNAVSPGIIETPMTADLVAARGDVLIAATPLGRLGQASEVASVIVFLCSPAASFVNGETIQINGGLHQI